MDGAGSASEATSLTAGCHSNYEATNGIETQLNNSQFVIAKCRRNTDPDPRTSTTDPQVETGEESEVEDRILSVYWRAGALGAARYTLQTGELYVLDEIVDRGPEHAVLRGVLRQAGPRRLLAEAQPRGSFAAAARAAVLEAEPDEGHCMLEFLSPREYNFEACKRRVQLLSLPHEPAACSPEERVLFLRTVLDFSLTQSVHALGALLKYLDVSWSQLGLPARPDVLSLKRMSLADLVSIDADTYRGLQVFRSEPHPSALCAGARGAQREGLSLYRLLGRCCSSVGQRRMKALLQHPSCDPALLSRRLDVVQHFTSPHADHTRRNICSSLRFIKNVNGILTKIKALSAKPYQWKSLYNTLYNAVLICEMCEQAKGVEFLETIASCDNNQLYEMALYMNRIIDFDLSKSEGKFTVKAGVDPELDRKKQTMSRLHGLMSATARAELARLPARAAECAMLYMPHLGYVLGVRAWADRLAGEDLELPDMKFMFQNNDYIHYKTRGCEELDALIGDAYPEIVAHETRVMLRLTAVVLRGLSALSAVVDLCAELDCLIAISKVCKEHNFVRPTLTRDKVLDITGGWHPLHAGDSFVPNDTRSSADDGLVKVLMGPNASGKSVYMKQVGLIVYLAHVGSFVPAAAARVGLVRRVRSRLQASESVAGHMSAFLIDLRQMSLCLRESCSESLVIIDEFGKGTAEVDGVALLASCVNSLLCRGARCPHVLLASHLYQLPEYIIKTPLVRFQSFEYMVSDGAPVFLFRLAAAAAAAARAGGGLALQVAAAAGVPARVAARARDVMTALQNNTLPAADERAVSKVNAFIEMIKTDLFADDV